MAAAHELSRRGVASAIVEKEPRLGGLPSQLACKGSPRCVRCDACYPRDLLAAVRASPLVRPLVGARLLSISGGPGDYIATIRTAGADEDLHTGAVIVATGAAPFDVDRDPRLHHGDCPGVMTSLEVERALVGKGRLLVPGIPDPPQDMAVVQCVGSRDLARGVPYCSKACCKYAFKLGQHLRSIYPELRLTFFYMDWRPLEDGPRALAEWAASDPLVKLVRSRPAEVLPGPRPMVRYAASGDEVIEEEFDMVMLTLGITPSPDTKELASVLHLEPDRLGFLPDGGKGVFTAGCCRGPRDIRESVEDGVAAAGRAAALLEESP